MENQEILYEELVEIGYGVNTKIHKARLVATNEIVAVKKIEANNNQFNAQELETKQLLSHSNLLKPSEMFIVNGVYHIIMPYMAYGSIQSMITSGNFVDGIPEKYLVTILKQVLQALAYIHAQNHVIQDIDGGNILVDHEGSVKLSGFWGCAGMLEGRRRPGFGEERPYWVAPEVVESNYQNYTSKSDIYSFGVTALELATGLKPPISSPSTSLNWYISTRSQSFDFGSPDSSGREVKPSEMFHNLVYWCLLRDPGMRPTAAGLLKHHPFFRLPTPSLLLGDLLGAVPKVENRVQFHDLNKVRKVLLGIEDLVVAPNVEQPVVRSWTFNSETFVFDPVY